ncbi:autotransporter outer membrane beta-barrel domain-containing protein [Bartonella sp. MR168JLCBS]|uniref:autotransporter outer membrane beta-barrel domain-containing protein n=1 Tax=Bartonella sp. MR168JLCBS TaxID=3243556 RepID=UPI0035D0415C
MVINVFYKHAFLYNFTTAILYFLQISHLEAAGSLCDPEAPFYKCDDRKTHFLADKVYYLKNSQEAAPIAAIYVAKQGTIVNASRITVTGDNPDEISQYGAFVQDSGKLILTDSNFKDIPGLRVLNGVIQMNDGKIEGTSHAIYASGKETDVALVRVNVEIKPDNLNANGIGIVSGLNAFVRMSGSTVTFNEIGAFSTKFGGRYLLDTMTIEGKGKKYTAIVDNESVDKLPEAFDILQGGAVYLRSSSIVLNDMHGFLVKNFSAFVNSRGQPIHNYDLSDAFKKTNIEIESSNISVQGKGVYGLYFNLLDPNTVAEYYGQKGVSKEPRITVGKASVRLKQTTFTVPDGTAIYVTGQGGYGASVSLDLSEATKISGDLLLKAEKNSSISIKASASSLTGGAHVEDTSTARLELTRGSTWYLTKSKYKGLQGSVFTDSSLSSVSLSDSTFIFNRDVSSGYQTLRIGNERYKEAYNAEGNVQIKLSTFLNDDGLFDSQKTDRILIDGDVSGATLLVMENFSKTSEKKVSGEGSNSISLIQVSGYAREDSFKLMGDYTAINGLPYQYRLRAYGPSSSFGKADPMNRLVAGDRDFWDFRLEGIYISPKQDSSTILPIPPSPSAPVDPTPTDPVLTPLPTPITPTPAPSEPSDPSDPIPTDPSPSSSVPITPTPAPSEPSDPSDPIPTDPSPSSSVPITPTPAPSEPSDPSDPTPADPSSSSSVPITPTPAPSAPSDPSDPTPADPSSSSSVPITPTPVSSEPSDPSDPTPADPSSSSSVPITPTPVPSAPSDPSDPTPADPSSSSSVPITPTPAPSEPSDPSDPTPADPSSSSSVPITPTPAPSEPSDPSDPTPADPSSSSSVPITPTPVPSAPSDPSDPIPTDPSHSSSVPITPTPIPSAPSDPSDPTPADPSSSSSVPITPTPAPSAPSDPSDPIPTDPSHSSSVPITPTPIPSAPSDPSDPTPADPSSSSSVPITPTPAPSEPSDPSDPTPTDPVPTPPVPVKPDIQPEMGIRAVVPQLPTYLLLPNALFHAGLMDFASQNKKLKAIRSFSGGSLKSDENPAFFIRGYGGSYHYASNLSAFEYGYGAELDYSALEAGVLLKEIESSESCTFFGVTGTYGKLSLHPLNVEQSKKSAFDKWSVGAYGSLQHDTGFYIDGVLSYGLFKGDVLTLARGKVVALKGKQFSGSLTSGRTFATGYKGVVFDPQIQVVYQHLQFNPAHDVDNIEVDLGKFHQWVGRVGGRLSKTLNVSEEGRVVSFYSKLSYLHSFEDKRFVSFKNDFQLGFFGSSLEAGLGFNARLSSKLSLYGDINYQHRLTKAGFSGASFSAGLRHLF